MNYPSCHLIYRIAEINVTEDLGFSVQEDSLNIFKDEESKTTQEVVKSFMPPSLMVNPFHTDTPKQILERWQRIASQTLTSTAGVSPIFFDFSNYFTPQIVEALRTFRYLRFKAVEFKIQWSAMAFMYGWFAMSCCPRYAFRPSFNLAEVASTVDAVICDIGNQKEVIMTAPWISPVSWRDLADLTNFSEWCQSYVLWLTAPNPALNILDSSNASSITLQIFMRVVEPEVSGPVFDNGLESVTNLRKFVTQSKFGGTGNFMWDLFAGADWKAQEDCVLRGKCKTLFDSGTTMDDLNSMAGSHQPPPNSQPSEGTELKPNLYGSMVHSPDKFMLGSGNQISVPGRQTRHTLKQYIQTPTLVSSGNLNLSATPNFLSRGYPSLKLEEAEYCRVSYLSQYFRLWHGSMKYTLLLFGSKFTSGRLNLIINYSESTPYGYQNSEVIQDISFVGSKRIDFEVPFIFPEQWAECDGYNQISPAPDLYNHLPSVWYVWLNTPEQVGDITHVVPYVLYRCAGDDFEFSSLKQPVLNKNTASFQAQMKVMSFCAGGEYSSSQPPHNREMEMTFEDLASRWSYRDPDSAGVVAVAVATTYPILYQKPLAFSNWYNPNTDTSLLAWPGIYDSMSNFFVFWSGSTRFKIAVSPPTDPGDYSMVGAKLTNGMSEGAPAGRITEFPTNLEKPEDGLAIIDTTVTKVLEFTCPWVTTLEYLSMRSEHRELLNGSPQAMDTFTLMSGTSRTSVPFWYPEVFTELEVSPVVQVYVSAGEDFCLYYPIPPPPIVYNGVTMWPISSVVAATEKKATSKQKKKVSCMKAKAGKT